MPSAAPRLFFLDNLRVFVVFLVVILHGSLIYMAYAPEWWYVLNPENSIVFTMMVLVIDVPIMMVMFFLAGFFAYPSLARHGSHAFFTNKFIRIGIPWIFGVLLLAPPTAYMILYSRQVPVSLFHFWTHEFWSTMFQQSVYWFLGILFVFFMAVALLHSFSRRFRSLKPTPVQPTWKIFLGFTAFMTAGFLTVNQFFPLDTWYTRTYILVFQPLRAPLYIGYFSLGMYAYHRGWFTQDGYMPRLIPWGILCLLSGYLYLTYRLHLPASAQTTLLLQTGNAALFNTFCLSSLMAGIVLFKLIADSTGPGWKSLSTSSYGIYYIHPLILYPLAYIFRPLPLPLFVKATVVITGGFALSWMFSTLVLKKMPLLRNSF